MSISPKQSLVRFSYGTPLTPARVIRLLRAPSLRDAVGRRVVLITGASSGIGRAAALQLGAAGATVLLVARSVEALHAVAAEIGIAGGTAHVHPCDLRDRDAVDGLATEIIARYGYVDVLVNNAGHSIRRPVHESHGRLHDFERTVRLNYLAAAQLTLALLPSMRRRRSGHIINVGTFGVHTSTPRFAAYVGSKAALDGFSRCLAAEVFGDGVRVTMIHPPFVHTPMIAPSGCYDDVPGLTADEAANTIAEAIRTKPARLGSRVGMAFEIARLLAPGVVQRAQSWNYVHETKGRDHV